ncbi:MAG: exodeoxyribonuclease VII small subunit [Anaerolineales bacterium]|jgi:exodeoxyribonuclease VII small subunit
MAKTETKPIDKLTYEQAYAELEVVVSALETGEQSLDEALVLFERGMGLTKHCAELLDKAELRIRSLSGETLEPFEEKE